MSNFDLAHSFSSRSLELINDHRAKRKTLHQRSTSTIGGTLKNSSGQNSSVSFFKLNNSGEAKTDAPFKGLTLRDALVFASKQIFLRGFEPLNVCYFDYGFDLGANAAVRLLFQEVDGDKDGRLGIMDIVRWAKTQGRHINTDEAASMIRDIKPDGGFLGKLDFIRVMAEREMAVQMLRQLNSNQASSAGGEGATPPSTSKQRKSTPLEKPTVVEMDEATLDEIAGAMPVNLEDLVWATFVALDADRDGWISLEDARRFCRALNFDIPIDEETTWKRAKKISFDQFEEFFKTGSITEEISCSIM